MEAVAAISFVSVARSLADYGTRVVQRLNEFKAHVRSDQLPLLVDTVDRLHAQAKNGDLSPSTATALLPVVRGIHSQVTQLDAVLVKVLPSARASTWEKGLEAVKSVAYQKTVEILLRSLIASFRISQSIRQTTYNGDPIKTLIHLIERTGSQQPQTIQVAPSTKPYFMVRYETNEDFIGREGIMKEIR